MRKIFITIAQVIAIMLFPVMALAQQELLSDPEIYEKDHFRKECQNASFGEGFITRMDINNDGIIDAIANHGEITCGTKKGVGCTDEGCPYNFYLQVKEGGYFMIATAQIHGYDFIKRFGNMVFVFKMAPKYCERTDDRLCEMTVRVRGARMVTVSKK
ncbi:hypothetical protein [Rhizobium sp. FY34]|uniref:hypothetical protein n=1 Tax=Rhizobium sp. FY34 TaxID=2562309 RepID=UPI0014856060|nr:hypothetical protein [Rhizobium sp. FY34]